MKKLFFALSALAALSLLAPSSGFAQYQNHIGLYFDEAATTVNQDVAAFSQTTVYVVLTSPYNTVEDSEVTFVHGYEMGVVLNGPGLILGLTWPVSALNVGSTENQIVAYGLTDVQVIDDKCVVAEMNILYSGTTEPLTITLTPTEPASAPGMMAFLDANASGDGIVPAMTSSGDFAEPVIGFNPDPDVVGTTDATFDNIKAMFR